VQREGSAKWQPIRESTKLLQGLGRGTESAAELSPAQQAALSKVVLARRSDVTFSGDLDPLALLEALQERDPRAYQVWHAGQRC